MGALTVYTVVIRRVSYNGVSTTKCEVVLTVNLVLAAVHSRGAGPDVNMALAIVIVSDWSKISSVMVVVWQ